MQPPWLAALEAQLDAIETIKKLIAYDMRQMLKNEVIRYPELHSGWQGEAALLKTAAPFAWSDEAMRAVITASQSIPLDTRMTAWNLATPAAWWHFATPLPFSTSLYSQNVRALGFGWIKTRERSFGLPCHTWIDDQLDIWKIAPSQTFEWSRDESLGEMLVSTRDYHQRLYGPGGKWEQTDHGDIERYMAATEGIARFLLAGLAWLNQKVLITDAGHIERHRRKAFDRATGQTLADIRVVQLRKNEYPARGHGETEVEWSCRWAVSGHWRNQACGPKHGDRQLRYIMPFVKGPSDKPFREAPKKVYEVSR